MKVYQIGVLNDNEIEESADGIFEAIVGATPFLQPGVFGSINKAKDYIRSYCNGEETGYQSVKWNTETRLITKFAPDYMRAKYLVIIETEVK